MQPCMLQSPPVGGVPEQGSLDVLLGLNEVLGCQEGLRSPVQRLCIAPILLKHLRSITALMLSRFVGGHFACHDVAGGDHLTVLGRQVAILPEHLRRKTALFWQGNSSSQENFC